MRGLQPLIAGLFVMMACTQTVDDGRIQSAIDSATDLVEPNVRVSIEYDAPSRHVYLTFGALPLEQELQNQEGVDFWRRWRDNGAMVLDQFSAAGVRVDSVTVTTTTIDSLLLVRVTHGVRDVQRYRTFETPLMWMQSAVITETQLREPGPDARIGWSSN